MLARAWQWMIGEDKDPLAHDVFHQLALAAFLAWVGLGADGLSSSAYGPEEAFKALGTHHALALYLVFATAITVFVISASYSQIIELFPSGGGGYVVATRLLGPRFGLVSGSALVVDYVLTVSISIAAGVDALASFFPFLLSVKMLACVALIAGLVWLNMRGLKESIKTLLPIFLVFVFTHLVLIVLGVAGQASQLPHVFSDTVAESHNVIGGPGGLWSFIVLLFTAYSLGGGTYTGIEAVSNGLSALKEPRVRTGKRTMLLMATSLAFTAGGILLCYMLWALQASPGETMNAVLTKRIFGSAELFGIPLGGGIVFVTLLSEGCLLFIAAQAGFVDGPNVLSSMAQDSWVPHRFANLSSRLVRQNGIVLIGLAALGILYLTKGEVSALVVLYSINVFITFSLSQLAMCRHWWQVRASEEKWKRRFALNFIGLAMTSIILVATTIIKFGQGGWITMVITGSFVALCLVVQKHYDSVKLANGRLDELLLGLDYNVEGATGPMGPCQSKDSTAVMLVREFGGLGVHSIFSMKKLFRVDFKNLIFVSVGRVDTRRFKGADEIAQYKDQVEADLKKYVALARGMGYCSDFRMALGTDVFKETEKLCESLSYEFEDPVYFAAKLVFRRETFYTRFLHNQTCMELQRRMLFAGHNLIILPIRVL
jgi:amino acid transporter